MEKDRVKEIIDKHEQIHEGTCTPSAVEMILKLEGKVEFDFYELQNKFAFHNGANYNELVGEHYGLFFTQKFSMDRNNQFPIFDLFNEIEKELKLERYVSISLFEGVSLDGKYHCFHNYIIYDNQNNDFQAITRIFKDNNPRFEFQVKKRVLSMKGTDILVYEKIEVDC